MSSHNVVVTGTLADRYHEILTPQALQFLATLDNAFAGRRIELLDERRQRRVALSEGTEELSFLDATEAVRTDADWRVAGAAPGLFDRRVEITGPPERKMAVNALNSGAKVWLADFEDATSPTWSNVVEGQLNLRDAVTGSLDFTSEQGKHYAVGDNPATIVVRPRGWHLVEKNIVVDGRPLSGAIVDFGLYFFHCAHEQLQRGSGPYFYLPKLENHREARLWNDVFCLAQDLLGIERGTIRATVLIETITAAFEMEEILYELREHCAGLNAGRWDYIFSVIKNFGARGADYVLPDRAEITMTVPFMRAYTELLVRTCHKRGAHAIGGMAAFLPAKDPEVNEQALAKVRQDKEREAGDGFDGSWVAHPGLVPICSDAFDAVLGDRPNQLERTREDVEITAEQLTDFASAGGAVTETGLRNNISVALRYIDAWLRGSGAVAINNLMEDAATAEISRCQLWQWIHAETKLDDGRTITTALVSQLLLEEYETAVNERGEVSRLAQAKDIVAATALRDELPAFFTPCAYARYLVGPFGGRPGQVGRTLTAR